MTKNSKVERTFLSKPGDTLIETIEHLKMSQAELAERMGKTPSKINDIISGKEPITINTALQLEKVLGIDAKFWLNREATYREQLARVEEAEKVQCWIPWARRHPVRELAQCGYIRDGSFGIDTVIQLLLFYGVASPEQWEAVCLPKYFETNFRKSEAYKPSISSISAWLRMGEIEMKKMHLDLFDKEEFRRVIDQTRMLAKNQPKNFAEKLRESCKRAGVALVYTRCLPHAPISGATRWIAGNPLIQLSDKYKTNDHFWFTFFHEAGHVMLHGKKEVFLEEADNFTSDREKEEQANVFASKLLLPEKFVDELPAIIADSDIKTLATKYQTHPGIVVGRLQRLGRLTYAQCNHLKVKIALFD